MKADSLEDGARALARRVAASLRGGPASCELRNLSSLEGAEFASVSAAFQDELQKRGVKLATTDAPVGISVSVTQSPTEYMAVAQIQRKENPETILETLGPVKGLTQPAPAFSLELHRELLFSQDTPVLDVLFDNDAKRVYALGTQEISTYEVRDDQLALKQTDRLPPHPSRRSERGYLATGVDSETVYWPDAVCTMVLGPGSKEWTCGKSVVEVPVRQITQDELMGKRAGAWFSAAKFESDGKARLVLTGQDGMARMFGDGREPLAIFAGWGGEIASVHSGCGSGWQLLVTGAGDWTKTDAIQVTEIKERRAVAVSAPMEFPGAILMLHTPGVSGAESASATAKAVAVERNLQTGRYEAYLLSITCVH